MKFRKFAVESALVIASTGIAAGTAYAAPVSEAPLRVDIAPHINNKAYGNGNAAVITTDAGTLTAADGQFQIKAADGTNESSLRGRG